MEPLLFTILIPAYKVRFLKECIDSILNQTYTNFELVIVNDASPENIDDIVMSYKDSRIHYYKNEKNYGAINVVDNWNKCLSYANGDYIICMGDDDMLYSNCLAEYVKLINQYPSLDIYHGRTMQINEKGKEIFIQEARPSYETVYSLIWHRWHGRIQYIGDFLFKKNSLEKKGGFYRLPLAWGADDITVYILSEEKGIANTEVPIFMYRENNQTISSTVTNSAIKMDALQKQKIWCSDFLQNKNPNNYLDMIYLNLLNENNDKYFIKKKIEVISLDICQLLSPFKLLFWLRKRTEYQLSLPMIIYAFFDALKIKYRH